MGNVDRKCINFLSVGLLCESMIFKSSLCLCAAVPQKSLVIINFRMLEKREIRGCAVSSHPHVTLLEGSPCENGLIALIQVPEPDFHSLCLHK